MLSRGLWNLDAVTVTVDVDILAVYLKDIGPPVTVTVLKKTTWNNLIRRKPAYREMMGFVVVTREEGRSGRSSPAYKG